MIIQSNLPAANLLAASTAPRAKSISQNPAASAPDSAQPVTAGGTTTLTAAGTPITDEDAASSSTESIRQMIIAQNAMAMTAQANVSSLSAIRLLQQ